jgi:riboflavin synthase
MFTGLVEELGRIRRIAPNATGARLEIEASTVVEDASLGASIAVNGCCLTVVDHDRGHFAADAVEETLARTCLGRLSAGDPVNLERPVRLADRLGGHLVQGHVDGVAEIIERTGLADGSTRLGFRPPAGLMRYIVEKGSIAIDGVSLTVAGVGPDHFEIAMIPHTESVTTLGLKGIGAAVNVEVDVLAKYVERLMSPDSRNTEN